MKTIDEQIEYIKSQIVEWSGVDADGKEWTEDLLPLNAILATLEKVKAEQSETPGSR